MKTGCLQFAPTVGDLVGNIARADALLAEQSPDRLDLLVLPELALTGYNFPNLEAIQPHLEPTASGPSTQWALATARRLNCLVVVGYPEVALEASSLPSNVSSTAVFAPDHAGLIKSGANYNSAVTVAPNGQIVAHYRKSFLYFTDATWAVEGPGFHAGMLPLGLGQSEREPSVETKITMGVCMDINPYNFTAPWTDREFAHHVLKHSPKLNILSMAWSSHSLTAAHISGPGGKQPDLDTLSYWIDRFGPVVAADRDTILIMANRCGIESEVCYTGTSTVMRVGRGKIGLWGICGKGEERCLIISTDDEPSVDVAHEKEGGGECR